MKQGGETNLDRLLALLSPSMGGQWAFCLVSEDELQELAVRPLMVFREREGITAIVPAEKSEGLDVRFLGTRIDLMVHSSLDAVGLTAAVATSLATMGISANVVAAIYHDYIFVPNDRAEEALAILSGMAPNADV